MRSNEIKVGETYTFVGSENQARAHLAGEPFTVTEIRPVWRRLHKQSRKVKRFFNADGVGARADELEPIDQETTTTDPKALNDISGPYDNPWGD